MQCFIGQEALKYIFESKDLRFIFTDSKCDDYDMLRQLRSQYAKSNKLIRTFSQCSIDIKIILFQSWYTAMYCPFLQGR